MHQHLYSALGLARVATESDQILAEQAAPLISPADVTPEAIAEIAKVAHETNRTADGGASVSWDDATEEVRQSAIDGVQAIVNDPTMDPEKCHENWMKFKQANGWVYGEVRSEEDKTHPCIRPYSELPEDERIKDQLFVDTVKSELAKLQASDIEEEQIPSTVQLAAIPEQAEVDDAFAALETLGTVADLLESADAEQGLSPLSAKLIEDMLASTFGPVDAGSMIPSAEAFKIGNAKRLTSFSKEGIAERIKAGITKLAELAHRVWAFLTDWIRAAFNELGRAKLYLNRTRKTIQAYSKTNTVGAIVTTQRMRGMLAPASSNANGQRMAASSIQMLDELSSRFLAFSRFANSFFKESPNSASGDYQGSYPVANIYNALDSLKGKLHQASGEKEAFVFSPSGLGWREAGIVVTGTETPPTVTDVHFSSNPIVGFQEQQTINGLSFSDADRYLSQLSRMVDVVEGRLRTIGQLAVEMQKVKTVLDAMQRAGNSEQRGHQRNAARLREIRLSLSIGRTIAQSATYVKNTTAQAVIGGVSLVNQSAKTWA